MGWWRRLLPVAVVTAMLPGCAATPTSSVFVGTAQGLRIVLVLAPNHLSLRPEVLGLDQTCLQSAASMDQDLAWGGVSTSATPVAPDGSFSLLASGGKSATGLVFTISGRILSGGTLATGSFTATVAPTISGCSIPSFTWLARLQTGATAPPTPQTH